MNRFTKGVGKFVQTHKTKLVNAGKGVVVAFFVGKELFKTRYLKNQKRPFADVFQNSCS